MERSALVSIPFCAYKESETMKVNAITIANWFVDKYQQDTEHQSNKLTLLRLVKLVYIAHGFMLAVCDRGLLDPRFDRVEAWRFGPVIPSVYHSFKHNGKNTIIDKASVLIGYDYNEEPVFISPELSFSEETDNDKNRIQSCLEFVWNYYILCNANLLVGITHKEGTPWETCYVPGENKEIPDDTTKNYYKELVSEISA